MTEKKKKLTNELKRTKAITLITFISIVFTLIFNGCSLIKSGINRNIGDGTGNRMDESLAGTMTKPVFSDLGGFYTGKMVVKVSVPPSLKDSVSKMTITFDGSVPSADSRIYEGDGILFPNAGCVTTDFEDSTQNVSVSVLRAACFDESGAIVGQIATATYIQLTEEQLAAQLMSGKISGSPARFNIPVISLVTDEVNLTGRYGIFDFPEGKGKEWERPVNITFFETDGSIGFTQDAGMRLSGESSRELAQKSFRITARKSEYFDTDMYDGKSKFSYAIFPDRLDYGGKLLNQYDSIVLRNSGNDSIMLYEDSDRITFMRDGLAAMIAQKAAPDVDAMAYRPAVVFLNGEYYGILNIREYQNRKYIQNVYDIKDEDNITVISSELDTSNGDRYDGTWFYYEQDSGPEGELSQFIKLMDDIVNKGVYKFEEASVFIDMDNFMKYCAINLFLCNTDWPHNNIRVWRYASWEPDKEVTDNRWRFMLKDADVGMGRYVCGIYGYPVELYTKADSRNIRFMLRQYMDFNDISGYPEYYGPHYPDGLYIQRLFYFCMQNESFAQSFEDFCETLACSIWTPSALEKLINDAADSISGEMKNFFTKNFGKWGWFSATDYATWENAVRGSQESLVTWAYERSGPNGEFMNQVREVTSLFEDIRERR